MASGSAAVSSVWICASRNSHRYDMGGLADVSAESLFEIPHTQPGRSGEIGDRHDVRGFLLDELEGIADTRGRYSPFGSRQLVRIVVRLSSQQARHGQPGEAAWRGEHVLQCRGLEASGDQATVLAPVLEEHRLVGGHHDGATARGEDRVPRDGGACGGGCATGGADVHQCVRPGPGRGLRAGPLPGLPVRADAALLRRHGGDGHRGLRHRRRGSRRAADPRGRPDRRAASAVREGRPHGVRRAERRLAR